MEKKMEKANYQNDHYSWSGDIFDERYYVVNKRHLSFLGLWPCQLDKERTIKSWLIVILGITGVAVETRGLIVTWGRLDQFVACMAPLMANGGCVIIQINFLLHRKQWLKIIDQTRRNWECLRGLPQIKILQEHGETGRFFTLAYITSSYIIISGWILTPLVPKILMIVLASKNYTFKRLDLIPADYMVDPDEFFWPIFIHLTVVITIGLSTLLAVDAFYMSIAQHAVAMFETLRYELENMLQNTEDISNVILNPAYHADTFFHNIVTCIKSHSRLIEYISDIQSTYELVLLATVVVSAVVLSFTGYQTVARSTPKEDVLRMGLFTIAQTYHLYCITLPGHWISCASLTIPEAAYACKWYMMSLRSRKLILLLIRASIKPVVISAGKVYDLSMENFCTILKTSMSYLTMLTSFQ